MLGEFDKLTSPLFVEEVKYENIVEKLPKESREKLKEFIQVYLDQNLPKMAKFLEENSMEMGGPKLVLNKKTEKSFSLAQKYFNEDKLKNEENTTVRVNLFLSQVLLGHGLFIWPVSKSLAPVSALTALKSTLAAVKGKLDQAKLADLEALIDIGLKPAPTRAEVSDAKSLFKSLNKLI